MRVCARSVIVVILTLTTFSDFVLLLLYSLVSIILLFIFMLPCFLLSADEQREAAASSPQPHPLPAAVRGAGKQPAPRYPGCKRRLRWGQEEPLLWPLAGAGAAAGELHECRLSKRPVVRLRPQFPLQGEGLKRWTLLTTVHIHYLVLNPSSGCGSTWVIHVQRKLMT